MAVSRFHVEENKYILVAVYVAAMIYTIRTCILKFRDNVSVIVAHCTLCLVNSSKYTSRRNSSIGETSSIFFNRGSRITIAKTIYKMHVALFHMRK